MRPTAVTRPSAALAAPAGNIQTNKLTDDHIWLWEAYTLAGGLVRLDDFLTEVSDAHSSHKLIRLGEQFQRGNLVKFSLENHVWLPRFQFTRSYGLFLCVPQAIACLPNNFGELDVALWFCNSNSWLQNEAPMDMVQLAGEAVVAAAQAHSFKRAPH